MKGFKWEGFLKKATKIWINVANFFTLKLIYSEKATNFCEISNVDLSYAVTVKSKVEISQNFVDSQNIWTLPTKYLLENLRFLAHEIETQQE